MTTYHLGRSYEALGDRAKAVEKYRLIAQSGVTGEQADYAKGRLLEWGVVAPAPQAQPR